MAQGIIDALLFVPAPEGSQIIRRKAENRACQHTQQRNILPGIGNGLQEGRQGGDLLGLHQIHAAVHGAADALCLQCPAVIGPGRARRAQEDHNVLRLHPAQVISVADQGAGIQHLPDSRRRKGRLLRAGLLLGLQHIQLHRRVGKRRMGNPLPQGFRLAVFQAAHLRAHAGPKDIIDTLDHLAAGAEIVGKQNLSSLSRLTFLRFSIFPVLFQEDARVCQAELVDGLLHVAHQEAVLPLLGEDGENGILHAVGILILVHHDLPVSSADLPGSRCGRGAAFPQQQIQCAVLQVAEVQHPSAPLEAPVVRIKLPHQGNESRRCRRGLAKIPHHLGGVVGKVPDPFGNALLAGIADGFDPLRQLRVGVILSGEAQGAEPDILPGPDLVPGIAAA